MVQQVDDHNLGRMTINFFISLEIKKGTWCKSHGTAELIFVDWFYWGLAIKPWLRYQKGSLSTNILALFYACSPCHTPSILQWVVLMLPRDTPWLQEIKGSLGHISGGSIRGRNRNETEMIPKYSKREKKEVRPFYYSEARLEFQSWLNLLNADLIATGSTSNSIPDSLIRPRRMAPSKPKVCPQLGAF